MVRSWIYRLTLAGLTALPAAAFGQAAPPPMDVLVPAPVAGAASPQALVIQSAPADGVAVAKSVTVTQAASAGEYWIGVQLEPLPELITSQLKLERGMVVVHVFDDSPASKAEVKVNDILLRAGDKDIKEPVDLIGAVNEAKDKELVIVALRGGTETTLRVTPAKRQADHLELGFSPETPHARVMQTLEELYTKAPDGEVRLFAVRPGAVYSFAESAKFPSNLEVTVEKRGDKPVTIHVKRIQEGEDQTWEVTEDKLGELPEDIRGYVQQLLSGHGHGLRLKIDQAQARAQDHAAKAHAQLQQAEKTLRPYKVRVQPPVTSPQPAIQTARLPHLAVEGAADAAIQAKLDAILRKLDQQQGGTIENLQKQLDELRRDVEQLRQEKK